MLFWDSYRYDRLTRRSVSVIKAAFNLHNAVGGLTMAGMPANAAN